MGEWRGKHHPGSEGRKWGKGDLIILLSQPAAYWSITSNHLCDGGLDSGTQLNQEGKGYTEIKICVSQQKRWNSPANNTRPTTLLAHRRKTPYDLCCPLDWWQHSFSDHLKCAWRQKHIRALNVTLPMQTNADTCTHLYLRWAILLWVSASQCQSSGVSLRWKFHRDGVELITLHRSVLYYWTKVLGGDNWKVSTFISVFWACFLVNWS